jgi:hypothetical protein
MKGFFEPQHSVLLVRRKIRKKIRQSPVSNGLAKRLALSYALLPFSASKNYILFLGMKTCLNRLFITHL